MDTATIFTNLYEARKSLKFTFVDVRKLQGAEDLPSDPPVPDFLKSVQKYGVVVPIGLEQEGKTLTVAYGVRRIKAALRAGMDNPQRYWVPALVWPKGLLNPQAISLLENNLRRDNKLRDTMSLNGLSDQGFTDEEIVELGLAAPATIKARTKFRQLHATLYQLWTTGAIKDTVADQLIRLTAEEQEQAVKIHRLEGKLTADHVKKILAKRPPKDVLGSSGETFDPGNLLPGPTAWWMLAEHFLNQALLHIPADAVAVLQAVNTAKQEIGKLHGTVELPDELKF